METLLSSCIPELHAKALIFDVYSLGYEVDTYCRLNQISNTCSLPVKLSKMNRFMIEVLPTDWSPSRTILHFTAGLFYIFEIYIISTRPES